MQQEWINLAKYLIDGGYTKNQFEYWKRHGSHPITLGKHYVSGSNGSSVNIRSMDQWWSEGGPYASTNIVENRELESAKTVNLSSTKRSMSTLTPRVVSPKRLS